MPTVIELLSYVYFSSACICGPFFEFADYKNYIEMNGHYAQIPSTVLPALKRYGQSFICLVLNLVIGNYFWADYCGTEEFTHHSFFYKVSDFPKIISFSFSTTMLP